MTGGAGYIGSALIRHLLGSSRDSVVNLDSLTYAGNLESLGTFREHPRHHFIQADICDAAAVREAFQTYRPSGVLHLAAESHVDRSIDDPGDFVRTNIVGTYTLLRESLAYWRGLPPRTASTFRFVHVSTDEVFGSLEDGGQFNRSQSIRPKLALLSEQGRRRPSRPGLA